MTKDDIQRVDRMERPYVTLPDVYQRIMVDPRGGTVETKKTAATIRQKFLDHRYRLRWALGTRFLSSEARA
jgi:hypothetical protein